MDYVNNQHKNRGLKKRIMENMGHEMAQAPRPSNQLQSVLSAAIGLAGLGAPGCSEHDFSPNRGQGRPDLHAAQQCPPYLSIPRTNQSPVELNQTPYHSEPHPMNGKNFPQLLFEIVSDERNCDIISWLPHGQGFMIHDKARFATKILPRFFDGTKFTSFTRRLKRWNFTRVSRGPELGAYYNKHFVRDKPAAVQKMRYRITLENRALAKKKAAESDHFDQMHQHNDAFDNYSTCSLPVESVSMMRPLPDEWHRTSPPSLLQSCHDNVAVAIRDEEALCRARLNSFSSPSFTEQQRMLDLRTKILLAKSISTRSAGLRASGFLDRQSCVDKMNSTVFNLPAPAPQEMMMDMLASANHKNIMDAAVRDLRSRLEMPVSNVNSREILDNRNHLPNNAAAIRQMSYEDAQEYARSLSQPKNCYRASAA